MRTHLIRWALAAAPMVYLAAPATAQWSDNLDGYTAGTLLEGQGGWTHWDNGAASGASISTVFADSAPNAVAVGPGADSVQAFNGLTAGQWTMTVDVFAPTNFVGKTYFIMLNKYNVVQSSYQWAVQVGFNGTASQIECDCGTAGGVVANLVRNQWVELEVQIDLDADTTTIIYDGQQLATYPWSGGVFGNSNFPALRVRAVNLYPDVVNFPDVNELYFDNFVLEGETGIGTNYCTGAPNSVGPGAEISAFGNTIVANNFFNLRAQPVPDQPGIFFYGPLQSNLPFGNGFRCVDGFVSRLDPTNATNNVLTSQVDFTSPPTQMGLITSGSTWNFQAWYRDPVAGGALFNTSDGLEVMFQ